MKTRYFFRVILVLIVAVLFLVPISSASQEFEHVDDSKLNKMFDDEYEDDGLLTSIFKKIFG